VVKLLKPGLADHASVDLAAQQFYRIGETGSGPAGVAGGPASPGAVATPFFPTGDAEAVPARAEGGFVLDMAIASGADQPAGATIFPADEPPTVDESQILLALKDGSLFVLDADLLSGKPLELRDALAAVGIVFEDPAQGSDVLEEYGLNTLLGSWLSELQGMTSPTGAGDLTGHSAIF